MARGLADVPSGPIELTDCPAIPVGPDGWYLERPGFWFGAAGVAACWYGGARGLVEEVIRSIGPNPSEPILAELGHGQGEDHHGKGSQDTSHLQSPCLTIRSGGPRRQEVLAFPAALHRM